MPWYLIICTVLLASFVWHLGKLFLAIVRESREMNEWDRRREALERIYGRGDS